MSTLKLKFAFSVGLAGAFGTALLAQSPELPAGRMQKRAITACMECHDSSILVQQRLSRPAWEKEVDKMTKWGALVDPKERDALVDYFAGNFAPDKPPYVAPRNQPRKRAR